MVKRQEKDQGSTTLESSHEGSFESVGKVVDGVKSHSKIQHSADTKQALHGATRKPILQVG